MTGCYDDAAVQSNVNRGLSSSNSGVGHDYKSTVGLLIG